jgi:DNA-binding NtrC family response regulator
MMMSTNTILLVEDDLNLRNSFTLILQRAGYLVNPTDCAHKMTEMLRYGTYHLVIADLNMPETRELVIPTVLGTYPYLSLVVLTDQPAGELGKDDLFLSAYYLVKPVAPERLLDCIGMVLGTDHRIQ